ncbi:MAG: hypothetical protein WC340_18580, partial [Kiritimatiellia bacterium]
WLYQEIEGADPTLFTCTENREAAVELAEWRVVLSNPDRCRGFEENLAKEQQDFLSQAYGACGDEMESLTSHLERGFFRGFAHASPIYSIDGNYVDGFELYDQWNFARDHSTGDWWWNPDAVSWANDNFKPIPEGELITLSRSRHIDYPSLAVFIRAALGDKKWGIFLERFGIPPVTIIMPEFADKPEEAAYMSAAQKLAAAGSGALPFGSQVNYATEARATNPFTEFLRHQQELTVLMATGGLLTTLTESGSGTLAGGAHTDTWQRVVGRDLRSVGRAVNRTSTKTLLNHKFPGYPHLAGIEFATKHKPGPTEVLEDAAKAKTAGYLIKQDDLEEKSGYKLVVDPNPAGAANMGGFTPQSGFDGEQSNSVTNKALDIAGSIIASHCISHGGKITNKGEPKKADGLESVSDAFLSVSQNPVNEALKVIENGGTEAEAMAAYDKAAAAVLTPEKIAEGAEEISRVLEDAAKAGKGSENEES